MVARRCGLLSGRVDGASGVAGTHGEGRELTNVTDGHPAGAAARTAVELLSDPAVERDWTEPSVLDGYRVGGLAAHLVRAIETIRQYGEADPPPPGAVLVDAAGYYTAA